MDEKLKQAVLAAGPVGIWRTSAGSADALGADDVAFTPDGTGSIITRSAMFGGNVLRFHWAMAEPGLLRMRSFPEPDDEPDDEPDFWWSVRMEFRRQVNDLGELDVLGEVGQDGFWWLVRPLRWLASHADVTRAALLDKSRTAQAESSAGAGESF